MARIKVAFIKKDQTTTGKDKWSVKGSDEIWYTVWSDTVAAQLQDAQTKGYEVEVVTKPPKDPKYNLQITGVTPPGAQEAMAAPAAAATKEAEDFFGVKAEDAPEATALATPASATAPVAKPVVSELSLIVEERKHAVHMAVLAYCAGKISREDIPKFANSVIAYIQNSANAEHKISAKQETTDEAAQFIK